ncbi:MAG: hypothetical protein JNK45_33335 [Myxococcales bacterium]|nr:hypothetical protein [Myxococcales bacterium]
MSKLDPRFLLNQRCPSHAQGRHEIHRIVEVDWHVAPASDASEPKASAAATRAVSLSALAAVFATIAVSLLIASAVVDELAGWLAFAPLVIFAISLAAHSRGAR